MLGERSVKLTSLSDPVLIREDGLLAIAKAGGIGEEVMVHPMLLLPDRTWLYERCDLRFEAMLDAGAIAEVEALLARELDPDLPVMRRAAISCAPANAHIEVRALADHVTELAGGHGAAHELAWA